MKKTVVLVVGGILLAILVVMPYLLVHNGVVGSTSMTARTILDDFHRYKSDGNSYSENDRSRHFRRGDWKKDNHNNNNKNNNNNNNTTIQERIRSGPNASLGDFFRLLCHYNVTKCCRNESRLDVLDELSLTLGAVQSYDQQISLTDRYIPLLRYNSSNNNNNNSATTTITTREPLQCLRYQYEAMSPKDSTQTKDVVMATKPLNSFRRHRRLIYFPPKIVPENLRPIFTGPAAAATAAGNESSSSSSLRRSMIDVLMVSNELDMLQARMYELYPVMDYFVIIESSYNHRGWKKRRFVQDEMNRGDGTNHRFTPFMEKIIYIDIDTCPSYKFYVDLERTQRQYVGKDIWTIQESMRECVWRTMQPHLQHLHDHTLVMMADLDWVPCVDDLRHLRECEPSTDYGGYDMHFRMALKHKMKSTLLEEEPSMEMMNEKFTLTPLGYIRAKHGMPVRGYTFFPNKEKKIIHHPILCGVHLQLMGSLANFIYREVTHAEGSDLNKLTRILDGKSYCEIDDIFLQQQQQRVSQHSLYFHWRNNIKVFQPRDVATTTTGIDGETQQLPISAHHLQALRDAKIPSVLIDQWQWFPFYWGEGTYDMYSKIN